MCPLTRASDLSALTAVVEYEMASRGRHGVLAGTPHQTERTPGRSDARASVPARRIRLDSVGSQAQNARTRRILNYLNSNVFGSATRSHWRDHAL
jgi:hypothetical protein